MSRDRVPSYTAADLKPFAVGHAEVHLHQGLALGPAPLLSLPWPWRLENFDASDSVGAAQSLPGL